MTEILLFLLFAGVLFALVRTGKAGIRIEGTLPAFALSSLFGLGLSLITTSLLTGDTGAGTVYALIYMGIGTLLAAYLWHTGVMTRKVVLLAATLGTITGFVFLAPIMPLELGGIINVLSGASALTYGVVIICSVIVLALVTGRTFCGTICPGGLTAGAALCGTGEKDSRPGYPGPRKYPACCLCRNLCRCVLPYRPDVIHRPLRSLLPHRLGRACCSRRVSWWSRYSCTARSAGLSVPLGCSSPSLRSSAGSGCAVPRPVSAAGNARKPARPVRQARTIQRGSVISVGDVPVYVLSGLHSPTGDNPGFSGDGFGQS